jgi:hypothetical protein
VIRIGLTPTDGMGKPKLVDRTASRRVKPRELERQDHVEAFGVQVDPEKARRQRRSAKKHAQSSTKAKA